MCVTQLNRIEIKGNYRAPVHSYLYLAISKLLFQVLLTLTKASGWQGGTTTSRTMRDKDRLLLMPTHLKCQHSKLEGWNLVLVVIISKLIHLSQI